MKKTLILFALLLVSAAVLLGASGIVKTTTPLTAQREYNAATALEFDRGTLTTTTDGSITQSFATAFSAVPTVVVSPATGASSNAMVLTVTTSSFVVTNTEAAATKLNWIAIGPP